LRRGVRPRQVDRAHRTPDGAADMFSPQPIIAATRSSISSTTSSSATLFTRRCFKRQRATLHRAVRRVGGFRQRRPRRRVRRDSRVFTSSRRIASSRARPSDDHVEALGRDGSCSPCIRRRRAFVRGHARSRNVASARRCCFPRTTRFVSHSHRSSQRRSCKSESSGGGAIVDSARREAEAIGDPGSAGGALVVGE